jgi:uncharacterized membrane protein YhhN
VTLPILLLSLWSEAGPIGIAAGVAFFLIIAAVAYISFRLLRRTMKTAMRLLIVGLILLVAVIGSIAILWKSSGRLSLPRPSANRTR